MKKKKNQFILDKIKKLKYEHVEKTVTVREVVSEVSAPLLRALLKVESLEKLSLPLSLFLSLSRSGTRQVLSKLVNFFFLDLEGMRGPSVLLNFKLQLFFDFFFYFYELLKSQ